MRAEDFKLFHAVRVVERHTFCELTSSLGQVDVLFLRLGFRIMSRFTSRGLGSRGSEFGFRARAGDFRDQIQGIPSGSGRSNMSGFKTYLAVHAEVLDVRCCPQQCFVNAPRRETATRRETAPRRESIGLV